LKYKEIICIGSHYTGGNIYLKIGMGRSGSSELQSAGQEIILLGLFGITLVVWNLTRIVKTVVMIWDRI